MWEVSVGAKLHLHILFTLYDNLTTDASRNKSVTFQSNLLGVFAMVTLAAAVTAQKTDQDPLVSELDKHVADISGLVIETNIYYKQNTRPLLLEIFNKKAFLSTHKSMNSMLKERYPQRRKTLQKEIQAGRVEQVLEVKIGTHKRDTILPLAPLLKDTAKLKKAYKIASTIKGKKSIKLLTRKQVKDAVDQVLNENRSDPQHNFDKITINNMTKLNKNYGEDDARKIAQNIGVAAFYAAEYYDECFDHLLILMKRFKSKDQSDLLGELRDSLDALERNKIVNSGRTLRG